MNKKRCFIILIALLIISSYGFLFISRSKISNENYSIKNKHGIAIQDNVLNVLCTVNDARKDLSGSNISKLYRYYWQFNEFTKLDDLPQSLALYSINIRNDYGELIKLSENNSSQEEIKKINANLELELSKYQTALSLIMKECSANDYIKFYSLCSEGNTNATMKSVIKILTEDDKVSNRK